MQVELAIEPAPCRQHRRREEERDEQDLDGEGAGCAPHSMLPGAVQEGRSHRRHRGAAGERAERKGGHGGGLPATDEQVEAGHGEGKGEHVDPHEGGPHHEVGHRQDESTRQQGGKPVPRPVPHHQAGEDRDRQRSHQ